MPRIRSINPCAPVDEDVATMSVHARLVWAYLPCHADCEGRLRDSPFTLKLAILPADAIDMNALLTELADRRHVIRYEVDGRRFIQIRNFRKHQNPHKNETPSVCPPVPEAAQNQGFAKLPDDSRNYQSESTILGTAPADPSPDPGPSPDPEIYPPMRDPTPPARTTGTGTATETTKTPTVNHDRPFLADRVPYRHPVVGAASPAFMAVYEAYPRRDVKQRAAQVFQELAADHPDGETGLRDQILAWLRRGVLRRHPYSGENKFRPLLETVLLERRWEDDQSAPDDDEPLTARAAGPHYPKIKPIPMGVPRPR